jgi:O-methyltransferase
MQLKNAVKSVLRTAGLELTRVTDSKLFDQPQWIGDIVSRVQPYTMTSPERIVSLCQAIDHVAKWKIPGDVVECGVWRGGSMMAVALTLLHRQSTDRKLYLYDTFAGMTEPTEHDIEAQTGRAAGAFYDGRAVACGIEEVMHNIRQCSYPFDKVKLVCGDVQETIPDTAPERIALLRLDTDWYASTKHELTHLWPRLSPQGVLIIDDYGHWAGAREAVDEFLEQLNVPIFLHRIDYTGRLVVKSP